MTSNYPIVEQYRIAAKEWVQLDGAARMLEESKTAVLSQKKKALGEMSEAKAEKVVKASAEWADFIKQMVDARTAANLAKVKLKYVEMKYFEQQGQNATERAERRMG